MPYTPHSDDDIRAMLERVGVGSIEELFDGIPEALRIGRPLEIPRALSEADLFREMAGIAAANRPLGDRPSFLGGGCYHHFIPAAVDALSSRGEFLTAYTPYQPEVSQGTLRTIYEFQSFIALLTGMEIANASMYDGATAAAEAVAMAASLSKGSRVLVSEGVHPETRRVLETFLSAYPFEIDVIPLDGERTAPERVRKRLDGAFAFLYQSPNYLGAIEAEAELLAPVVAAGVIGIASVYPIALGLLEPPGVHGAEIVVGDGQPLGNPPSFGGPSLGFFAARAARVRRLPGRIAGGTIDRDGQAGCVLTFQTREQHIRRERATSNICTNQGLCATRGTIYMALLGKRGLQQVARTCFERAHHLAREAARIPGFQRVGSGPFFNELVIETTLPAEKLLEEFQGEGVRAGLPLPRIDGNGARERQLLVAVTEMNPPEDLEAWLRAAREIAGRNGWKA